MNMANAPEWSPLLYASNTGAACFTNASAPRQREQRELQQYQRVDRLGMVECQLGGDLRARGVTCDVSAPQTEMLEERRSVGGVVSNGHRRRSVGAADPAALVVSNQLVAVGKLRYRKERQKAVGKDGVDEQHGLARSQPPRIPARRR